MREKRRNPSNPCCCFFVLDVHLVAVYTSFAFFVVDVHLAAVSCLPLLALLVVSEIFGRALNKTRCTALFAALKNYRDLKRGAKGPLIRLGLVHPQTTTTARPICSV